MCHVFKDFLRKFLEIFMDDLCIYSTQDEHLDKLRMVLERCRLYQIALNPSKCQIMVSHGVVLGHIVSRRGIATDPDKVRVIQTLEPPRTAKEVQVFMGHMNYYRRFINGYVEMSRPIYGLMHNLEWTKECELAFRKLKQGFSTTPILKGPDWEK